jgi:hypothetical protein
MLYSSSFVYLFIYSKLNKDKKLIQGFLKLSKFIRLKKEKNY